jgi:DNA-binding response OmpR family regulator
MRILIVEDNADLVRNLYAYLEARGHELDHARDGVTGLHLAVMQEWDALVLGLTPPSRDGIGVRRRLRHQAGGRGPVVMLTAREAVPERVRGLEAGANDHLVKPLAMAELAARP